MKRTMKSESGRSMVEMLGVLAIIGVLSIGGIAGYTMAMNRYRANEIIDMGNKYASLVFAANQTKLARTGVGYDKYSGGSGTVPSVKDLGLTTTSGVTGSALPGGGKISVTAIDDDGVTVEMEFPTKGVCSAGANTLAITDDCSDNKISHEFRQS